MHICCRVVNDVANITERHTKAEVMSRKEENSSIINSDSQDKQKIRNKLEMSTDSLDPTDHSDEIVNIVTGRIAPTNGQC